MFKLSFVVLVLIVCGILISQFGGFIGRAVRHLLNR